MHIVYAALVSIGAMGAFLALWLSVVVWCAFVRDVLNECDKVERESEEG